ncbi:MAG: hypothetical protein WAO71_13855 [Gallionella sp.]
MLLSLLIPAAPPLVDAPVEPPAIIAQTSTAKTNMTLGVCEGVKTPDNPGGQLGGQLTPAVAYGNYMQEKLNKYFPTDGAIVTLLDGPMHGKVDGPWISKTSGPFFGYVPNHGFLGQDKITFLVEVGGKRIKMIYTVHVDNHGLYCDTANDYIKRISDTNTSDFATAAGTRVQVFRYRIAILK